MSNYRYQTFDGNPPNSGTPPPPPPPSKGNLLYRTFDGNPPNLGTPLPQPATGAIQFVPAPAAITAYLTHPPTPLPLPAFPPPVTYQYVSPGPPAPAPAIFYQENPQIIPMPAPVPLHVNCWVDGIQPWLADGNTCVPKRFLVPGNMSIKELCRQMVISENQPPMEDRPGFAVAEVTLEGINWNGLPKWTKGRVWKISEDGRKWVGELGRAADGMCWLAFAIGDL